MTAGPTRQGALEAIAVAHANADMDQLDLPRLTSIEDFRFEHDRAHYLKHAAAALDGFRAYCAEHGQRPAVPIIETRDMQLKAIERPVSEANNLGVYASAYRAMTRATPDWTKETPNADA